MRIINLIALLLISFSVYSQKNNKRVQPVFSIKGTQIFKKDYQIASTQRALKPDNELKFINFNPSIQLNANIQHLPLNIEGYSKLTVFIVYQSFSDKEMAIWGNTKNGRKTYLTTHQMVGPAGKNTFEPQESGIPAMSTVTQFWGNTGRGSAEANMVLGGLNEEQNDIIPFEGYIPEMIVYNRSLPKQEREQIETILALKYGISLKHDYKNSNDDILWNYEDNEEYANRIAGIGRDDDVQLLQRKSKSTAKDAHIQIGVMDSGTLQNQQFLIWGDDNAPFQLVDKEGFRHIQRQWKLDVVNKDDLALSTSLKFDYDNLEIPKELQPYLVISKNQAINFYSKNYISIPANSISKDNIAHFNYNQWDLDKSGSDYFSFVFKPVNKSLSGFSIYPNPSNSIVTIDITLKEVKDVNLRIYDSSGKNIFDNEGLGEQQYQFKKEFKNSGVYLVELEVDGVKQTKEVIIIE